MKNTALQTPRIPIVTILLVLANLIAAYQLLIDPHIIQTLGFSAKSPTIITAFTHLFLHLNVIHLLGNMIFLAAVGGSVELAAGSLRFIIVYFFSGLMGAFFHYLALRHSVDSQPLIGASAAISGCAGYYAVRYPQLTIPVAPRISLSIFVITLVWVGLQVIGAVVRIGDSHSSLSYWAHVGGFLGGILLNLVFRAPELGQEKMDNEVLDRARRRGPVARVAAAHRVLSTKPENLDALRKLADALAELDDKDEEAFAIVKLINLVEFDEKINWYARLCEIKRGILVGSVRRFNFAKECKEESPACSIMILESIIAEDTAPNRDEALFLLAEICYELDPPKAAKALTTLELIFPDSNSLVLARERKWVQ